jgi:hypothetical protein
LLYYYLKHNLEKLILQHQNKESDSLLKKGVWAYFFLLIFEGALRKWILPGLATPLLVIRDPIALWLVLTAWKRGMLPFNIYLNLMVIVGIISIFTAGFLGHGNLGVALFGARILIIHFPLMFVIGKIFSREDVISLAKASLLMAIFMAILIFLQFNSPQSAWVNRGVGGDMEGAGYSGALGYFRPPGTFSFTTGVTLFFTYVAPLVCYFWLSSEKVNKFILIGATIALLASIPLSISRSLFFGVGVTFIFTFIAVSRQPKYLARILGASVFILIALVILSKTPFLSKPTEVFTARFENASESEGGVKVALVDRYLGGMVGALSGNTFVPFWGYGVGMGTNVGSMLLSGKITFLISEGEWGRLIGELGPLMGILTVLIRLGFCATITIAAYKKLVKGDLLPWLLLSNLLLVVPQGQWAQPTSLGFSTLIGGLIIASFRQSAIKIEESTPQVVQGVKNEAGFEKSN